MPLIAVFFLLNFVGNMYGTVWALYGYDAFQWNGLMVGLSLAGYGVFQPRCRRSAGARKRSSVNGTR